MLAAQTLDVLDKIKDGGGEPQTLHRVLPRSSIARHSENAEDDRVWKRDRYKHLKPFRSKRRNKDQNPPDPPAPAAPHPAAPHPAAPPPNTLPALRRHDAESTALAPSSNALQDWRERGEEAPQLESAEAVAASGVENEAAPQAGACVICCDRPADFLVTPLAAPSAPPLPRCVSPGPTTRNTLCSDEMRVRQMGQVPVRCTTRSRHSWHPH